MRVEPAKARISTHDAILATTMPVQACNIFNAGLDRLEAMIRTRDGWVRFPQVIGGVTSWVLVIENSWHGYLSRL